MLLMLIHRPQAAKSDGAPNMRSAAAATHCRVQLLDWRAEDGQQAAQDLGITGCRGVVQRAAGWSGTRLNAESLRRMREAVSWA